MTAMVPELRALPCGLVLDGELVAWKGGEPYFPHICRRVLNRDTSVPITFVIFDLLGCDSTDLTRQTYEERRHELVKLGLDGPSWTTCEAFDDGRALFAAVCELGYEGVVAKEQGSQYGPQEPGWVKIKNPNYWRASLEVEGMQRSRERRRRATWTKTI
jgi:bifunctional non-homologous end joining protein LigD